MQSKLVSAIGRKLIGKLMRRPSLVAIRSFSGRAFRVGALGGLQELPEGARPMVRITPKSLYSYDGSEGRELILSLDIALDCANPDFLADSELREMIERYMTETPAETAAREAEPA